MTTVPFDVDSWLETSNINIPDQPNLDELNCLLAKVGNLIQKAEDQLALHSRATKRYSKTYRQAIDLAYLEIKHRKPKANHTIILKEAELSEAARDAYDLLIEADAQKTFWSHQVDKLNSVLKTIEKMSFIETSRLKYLT